MTIPKSQINDYQAYLNSQNRASTSIREHIRYAERLAEFAGNRKLDQQLLEEYRNYIEKNYTTANSKNGCISFINAFLRFLGHNDLIIAYFNRNKTSRKAKILPLTNDDITKLLNYADAHSQVAKPPISIKGNTYPAVMKQGKATVITPATSAWYKGKHLIKLLEYYKKAALVIRLIITTDIRTQELPYVTVEAIKKGYIETKFNQSIRKVILPDDISGQLLQYAKERNIACGSVFLTIKGLPCDRNTMFKTFGKLAEVRNTYY